MDICPKCGLPLQACVCKEIAKTEQRIKIETEKRRYGKVITLVTGLSKDVDMKEIAKGLKSELACGGTVKNDAIELQGDHKKKVRPVLVKMGFPENTIED
ncbi:translation initiation factor Sui1 [Candidatus Pacearchaeota archaeon RBG_13_36_9]|nr:MAG: translation initiation factor Sui1 [Candidatus Pacearchaeota archaeon RBG_13_36_9]